MEMAFKYNEIKVDRSIAPFASGRKGMGSRTRRRGHLTIEGSPLKLFCIRGHLGYSGMAC